MRPPSSLSLHAVRVGYGKVTALDGLSLELTAGEFTVLLGPSGCGKSTLLGAIAGLIPIASGRVMLGDVDITRSEPGQRDISMVFQSYALYPTMTVGRNITFGMQMRGQPRAERAARLAEVTRLLRLDTLIDRKPAQLSGGQRQRVAIARALVRDPALFLFDEPLSNLDAELRIEMRAEIKLLQRRLGTTLLYVTHDQVEAMTLADRIGVMREGRILQLGDVRSVYDHPQDMFVARFVGSPGMNLVPGQLETAEDGLSASFGDARVRLQSYQWKAQPKPGHPVMVGLRPEDVHPASGDDVATLVTPVLVEQTGADLLVRIELNGHLMTGRADRNSSVTVGVPILFAFDGRRASVFCPRTGQRL